MTKHHDERDGIKGVNITPISPNADGYYEVVVGVLNQYSNAQQCFFPFNQKAFDAFKKRVEAGTIFVNVGNNLSRTKGRSLHDYMTNFTTISLDDIGAGINHVEAIHEEAGEVIIKALIKPCGGKADVIAGLLAGNEGSGRLAFGMRALVNKTLNADDTFKIDIDRIISFDLTE